MYIIQLKYILIEYILTKSLLFIIIIISKEYFFFDQLLHSIENVYR